MTYEQEYAEFWQGYSEQGMTVEELQAELAKLVVGRGMVDFLPIQSEDLERLAITADHLADGAVSSRAIAELAIQEAHISEAAIGSAAIQEAVITTAHIQDAAITSAKIGNAAIKNAHISDLSVSNASIQNAAITTAKIEDVAITTAKIAHAAIKTEQVADSSITDAKIVDLTANKITAGIIDTGQVTIQGLRGHMRISDNRLQVFDDQSPQIERVSLGDVNNDGSVYGFRVRGEDGQTVLYDEKGVYNEGITDGAITNPKIGDGAVENRNIHANTITGDKIVADAITAREIASRTITANHMVTNTITASSGVIADAAITNANIVSLSASKLTAGTIDASQINVINIDASNINTGSMSASRITTGTMSANRISGGTINANNINVTNLNASNITHGTIDASEINVINLNAANIRSGTMSASRISGGNLTLSNTLSFSGSGSREVIFSSGARISSSGVGQIRISASTYDFLDGTMYADDVDIDGFLNVGRDLYVDGTIDVDGSDIFTSGSYLRFYPPGGNSNNYIRMGAGELAIQAGGSWAHIFRSSGTKQGGSYRFDDGVVLGMSPIDSPQSLIEYLIFNQEVNEQGVIIHLDERFREAITGDYEVFTGVTDKPIAIEKHHDYFVLTGEQQTIGLRIIGIRKGEEDQFWADMSVDEEEKEVAKAYEIERRRNHNEFTDKIVKS